ncbi:MAG: putative sulfate exporter family transporter, partial [Rikenellaceae bacterium]
MNKILDKLRGEDWVIMIAGLVLLVFALLFADIMPRMPKTLLSQSDWLSMAGVFAILLLLVVGCYLAQGRSIKMVVPSLVVIFGVAMAAQLIAEMPQVKSLGLEVVLFSVLLGLIISNFFRVPEWLKAALNSEFYIKIG